MKKAFLALSLVLIGNVAMADQCAVVTKKQAVKALQMIQMATTVQSLCEPCGESQAKTLKVFSADLQTFGGIDSKMFAVNLDGKIADLAYTYVNGMNLAKIVGCDAHDVSDTVVNGIGAK